MRQSSCKEVVQTRLSEEGPSGHKLDLSGLAISTPSSMFRRLHQQQSNTFDWRLQNSKYSGPMRSSTARHRPAITTATVKIYHFWLSIHCLDLLCSLNEQSPQVQEQASQHRASSSAPSAHVPSVQSIVPWFAFSALPAGHIAVV